jgi:hypothetical protein
MQMHLRIVLASGAISSHLLRFLIRRDGPGGYIYPTGPLIRWAHDAPGSTVKPRAHRPG